MTDNRIKTTEQTSRTTTQSTTTSHQSTTTGHSDHGGHGGRTTTKSGGDGGAQSTASAPPVTTTGHGESHQSPRPVTVSDAFSSDHIKPTIWTKAAYGGDVSLAEQGGLLQLTVGADAVPGGPYNQIDVHVDTQCSFPGDFDARVRYKLLEWPTGDNIDVGMSAISGAVMRDHSSQSGDEYNSWVGSRSDLVPFSAMGGSLRIARVKGMETTYYWHGTGWQPLVSSREIGPAVIGLQAVSDGQNAFGGEELKVAFDDFTVTGIRPSCPPGAQRSRK